MTPPNQAARPGRSPQRAPETPSVLTGRDNRWLKDFRMALRGGLPTESGSVGVEGVRLVEEALRSTCRIEAVLFSQSGERHHTRLAPFLDRAELGFPVLRTTDRLFEGLADTEHPQGVAALVEPRTAASLDDLLSAGTKNAALLVILVGVQDPGNVGTILRTAAAFGATGAATCASGQSGTASPFSPKALRASAGAALHLPILAGMSLAILLMQLKLAGVHTLASTVHGAEAVGARFSASQSSDAAPPLFAPWEVDWCQPVALLVGNEGAGLPEELERSAEVRVRIPMASGVDRFAVTHKVDSLNAAAAAAVLFYEAARQRKLLTGSGASP